MIPWDDDFDMMTDKKNYLKLICFLKNQKIWENLDWRVHYGYIKIFFKDSQSAGRTQWKFPFIDIFFYRKNSSYVCDDFDFCTRTEHVFPLKLRPLGTLWLPAPRNEPAYLLSTSYLNWDVNCIKGGYDHRNERSRDRPLHYNCSSFESFYPFVHTECNNTHCVEQLKLENSILNTIVFEI